MTDTQFMGDFDVKLHLPAVSRQDLDAAPTPLDAVRWFQQDVAACPDLYVYEVEDNLTGERWNVDTADSSISPLPARTTMTETTLRTEAASQVARAIKHWGMSDVTVDETNPTILHATLRSPNTSRVFTATIHITAAQEI
jgi:hypothetical protein